MSQVSIYSMNFKSDGMWIVGTNFIMDGFNVANLTKDANDLTAWFMRIEESSVGIIQNSRFENIAFVLMSVTNSQLQLVNWYLSNITSRRNNLSFLTSTEIVLKNITTYNLYSKLKPEVLGFNGWIVNEISRWNFTETQLRVFIFQNTLVKIFDSNLINRMNKGILFTDGSVGPITNSTISNMVQNIKSGTIYLSNISSDGSAIGNFRIIIL